MQGYGRHFSILLCVLVGLWGLPPTSSQASCEVHTGTDTFANNTTLGQDICDSSGSKKSTLTTLLAGEDQTNNLIRTSGGAVRITAFSSVTSATTSSITNGVPTGMKTFFGQITNGTSETKALTVDIYGNWTNSTTGAIKIGTITMPSTASVTHLEDVLPKTDVNYAYYFYTVTTYTSASAAPFTLYAMY